MIYPAVFNPFVRLGLINNKHPDRCYFSDQRVGFLEGGGAFLDVVQWRYGVLASPFSALELVLHLVVMRGN